MKQSIFMIAGAAALLGSCTSWTQQASNSTLSCFRSDEVTGWTGLSDTDFIVRVRADEIYSARLSGCPAMDWAERIAVTPRRGGQICEGGGGTLIVRDASQGQRRCPAFNFHRLTPAEISALPADAQR